jgi:arylsulfatase A-like enzyme
MTKPNILFILVDSFRSDKSNGNLQITPNIDKLINQGIFFKNAFSSSDYTITGYGSIFTSLYPFNAGILGMNYHKIFSSAPNYLTKLKEFGYHNYCTIDSILSELGFSDFFENSDQGYDRTTVDLFNGLDKKILDKFTSMELNEPWFYFIHLDDLHLPVRVPKKFKNKNYNDRYDLVVSQIDHFVGELVKKIDSNNTIICLTADHGDYILSTDHGETESLNTRLKSNVRKIIPKKVYDVMAIQKRKINYTIKKSQAKTSLEERSLQTRTAKERFLYDDLIHVPLLFYGKNIPQKGINNTLVRSVDIFPTLASLIGMPDNLKIDGKNLRPIFNDEPFEEESVYLENTIFDTVTKNPQGCIGIRTKNYKYFRSLENKNKKVNLFDITNDLYEQNNLIEKNPILGEEMEKTLNKIRQKLSEKFEKPSIDKDEAKKVEEELKKLGYI